MLRSNRGAARVSAVWMISVGVVALAALAFAFIAQSDMAKVETSLANAQAAKGDADARFADADNAKREVSVVLGWYDRASADPSADVEAAKNALKGLSSTFPDVTETDQDFETVLPKIRAAYEQKVSEADGLRTRIQSMEDELAAAQAATQQVQSAKDQVIADLRSQISDEQQNSAQRQQELEDRLATVQQQLSDRDSELRDQRATMRQRQREYDKSLNLAQARITSLSKDLEFRLGDRAREADGRVIEVSTTLPVAFVDIGANQRVVPGMRFEVVGGTPPVTKAMAEVTRVEGNRAEVQISGVVDRWNPVTTGDSVVNELFDPHGTRKAVLAGSFVGQSRPELVERLARMGVVVQDELDYSTHFLILGTEFYNDPETNEPLEEPLPPTELPVYKEAVAQNVQIVPLSELQQFFRVGA